MSGLAKVPSSIGRQEFSGAGHAARVGVKRKALENAMDKHRGIQIREVLWGNVTGMDISSNFYNSNCRSTGIFVRHI